MIIGGFFLNLIYKKNIVIDMSMCVCVYGYFIDDDYDNNKMMENYDQF